MVVLIALMLPPQVTVVPLYVMWAKLHLVGTLWPLILPNWRRLSFEMTYWFSKAVDLGATYTNTAAGDDAKQGRSQSDRHQDQNSFEHKDQPRRDLRSHG